jgi:outer membrane protein assembly factor BamB
MNKRKIVFLVVFCIWTAFLTARIFQIHPDLMDGQKVLLPKYLFINKMQMSPNFIHGQSESNLQTTFEYGGSVTRQRFFESEIRPPLEIDFESEKINFGIHSASKASAAVDATGIYVGSDSGWIFGFDLDGHRRWEFLTSNSFRGIHGTASLDEDSLYLGSYNGFFYRLNKTTGRPTWATRLLNASGCSSLLWQDKVIICTESGNNGYLVQLDRQTGKMIWQTEPFGEQVHSSPTFDPKSNLVFIGDNLGYFRAYDFSSGQLRWSYFEEKAIKGTAILFDDQVCFSSWNSRFSCLNTQTGKRVSVFDLAERSQSSAALDPASGVAYVFSGGLNNLTFYAFDLRRKKVLWKNSMKSNSGMTSPILTTDPSGAKHLWGNCSSKSFCHFDISTGKPTWSISLQKKMTSTPTVFKNKIYLSMDDGPLVVLKMKSGLRSHHD